MGVALCTRTDLYPRVDLYLHTSEKMIGGAYLFFTGLQWDNLNALSYQVEILYGD